MPFRGRKLLARIAFLDRHRWAVVLTTLAGLAMTAFAFREAVNSERQAYDVQMREAADNRFSALRREIDALLAALEQARLLTGHHVHARRQLL